MPPQDLNGTEQPDVDSIPRSPAGTWLYGLLKSIGPERSLDPRGVWTEAIEQETGFTWDEIRAAAEEIGVEGDPTSGMSPDRPDWRLPLVEFMEPGDGTLQLDPDAHGLPFMHTEDLPEALRELVEAESTRLQLPAGMIATAGLVAAAAAIGSTRSVYTDDREHPAALWGVIVADTGAGKSPAMDVALSPYRSAARLRGREIASAWIDAAKWNKLKPEEREATPQPEIPPLMLTGDTTTESLAEQLAASPRGLLLDVDELTTWAAGMDAYRAKAAGPDRGRYCTMWNSQQLVITRKGAQPVIAERPVVTLIGGIHPHALKSLNSAPDGLAQRMLYTYHMDLTEPYPSDADPDHAVLAAWAGVIASLLRLDGDDRLKLTPAARKTWNTGRRLAVDAIRHDASRAAIYHKFTAMSARLALVLTLINDPEAVSVPERWMDRAWALLLQYYGPHACAALAGTGEAVEPAAMGWIREWASIRGGRVTRRDLVRYKVGGVTNNAEADELMADLQKRGLVRWFKAKRPEGGSPVVTLEVTS